MTPITSPRRRALLSTRERAAVIGKAPIIDTNARKRIKGNYRALTSWRDRIRYRLGWMDEEEFLKKKTMNDRLRLLAGGSSFKRVR